MNTMTHMISALFSRLAMLVMALQLGACAVGALSQPVARELRLPGVGYERAFSAAVRALNEVGSVTGSDRTEGYVNGRTAMAVLVTVQVARDGTMRVQGRLQGDKALLGTTVEKEMDHLVAALQGAVR